VLEAGRAVQELLKKQPNVRSFERLYADPAAKEQGKITAEEQLLLRLSETVTRRRREAAEARRNGVTPADLLSVIGSGG
jgi:hypothetical protein